MSNHRFIATELFRMVQGVIADAPQSIESSALQNTFYSKNEFICHIYMDLVSSDRGHQPQLEHSPELKINARKLTLNKLLI